MINNNDIRITLDKMRKGGYRTDESEKKQSYNPSVRDLLKITRNLNESDYESQVKINKATNLDQKNEEERFKEAFKDLNVIVDFQPLKIYDNYILWGGTINKAIQFVYKITDDESLNGVEINYLKGFKPEDPDNKEIAEKVENYYDEFFKRWKDQIKMP